VFPQQVRKEKHFEKLFPYDDYLGALDQVTFTALLSNTNHDLLAQQLLAVLGG
jgi:hypothetical protein